MDGMGELVRGRLDGKPAILRQYPGVPR